MGAGYADGNTYSHTKNARPEQKGYGFHCINPVTLIDDEQEPQSGKQHNPPVSLDSKGKNT